MSLPMIAGIIMVCAFAITAAEPEVIQEGLLAILKAIGLLCIAVPVLRGFFKAHKEPKKW